MDSNDSTKPSASVNNVSKGVMNDSGNHRLTNILLNERNFLPWSRAVTVALGARSKLGHINGRTKILAETDPGFDEWQASDLSVMSWIFNSMEPRVYEIFAYSISAKNLWDSIVSMYGQLKNASRIFEIQQEIAHTKQELNQSYTTHLGNLKRRWDELRQYRPITQSVADYVQREEEDRIFQLLASLRPEYEDLRRQILMNPVLPKFSEVSATIQGEETRRRVMNPNPEPPNLEASSHHVAARVETGGRNGKGKGKFFGRAHCDHCGRDGHTQERCWRLHPHLREGKMKSTDFKQGNMVHRPDQNSVKAQLEILSTQLQKLMKAQEENGAEPNNTHGPTTESSLMVQSSGKALSAQSKNFIIDSGATDHMSNSDKIMTNIFSQKLPPITVANGMQVPTQGAGKFEIFSKNSNALIVPNLSSNLLSVSKCTKEWNCNVIFSASKVLFQDCTTRKMIGEGNLQNGLYVVNYAPKALSVVNNTGKMSKLWHNRLGHPSDRVLKFIDGSITHDSSSCDCCHFAKQHRLPFPRSLHLSPNLFDLIHSDVWSAPIESRDGFKYFVTFIDDKSRLTWLYLLKNKHEVFNVFCEFCAMLQNQFKTNLKVLRTDNGTEYTNQVFQSHLRQSGVIHQTSCVGTPQQNGIAERKNRHLLEVTRALLFTANMPKKYWSDAVLTSCYTINRLPSRILAYKAPSEILYGRKYSVSHLRIFGSTCYVHSQNYGKFEPRARKCVFVGYSSTKKGYKCHDPVSNKLYISRDVQFDEDHMYYSDRSPLQGEYADITVDNEEVAPVPIVPTVLNPTSTESDQSGNLNQEATSEPLVRRSTRITQPSIRLRDFVTYNAVQYPIQDFVKYDKISNNYRSFLAAIEKSEDPRSYDEARHQPVWTAAMKDELQALENNHTWEVVKLPSGKRTVGCRWIYKTKYNSDGSVERHKARLVAKGYTQTYGIDYKETFAPVVKMNTVRVLMSVAVNCGWNLYQMDVKNAFLHGNLTEEVYMDLPPGQEKQGMVCKLKKSIYGLKQSPRAWYSKLSDALTKFGFVRSMSDSSMFTKKDGKGIVILLVYVDDIVITGSSETGITSLKQHLRQVFDIKDLGKLRYFLGIEVAKSHDRLFLSQRKYTLDLLKETGKLGAKPSSIPMEYGKIDDNTPLQDIGVFQRLVGKLIYLTITRPDISYAVSYVSQFMKSPTQGHMNLIDRVLRYLKGTPGRGILMKNNGHTEIAAYTDADWAGSPNDRKSTTGFCIFIGGNIVTWKSKKQSVVARSSAEAEYRAMATTTSEIVWLHLLLQELGCKPRMGPTQLYCDNQAATHIASNPVFHERTKHIEVDCHFVREKVQDKTIETPYLRNEKQLADIFTKALSKGPFQRIAHKLTSDDIFGPT